MAERRAYRWLREPLVHFLVLGALIFGVLRLRSVPDDRLIQVDPARVQALTERYQSQHGRVPSAAEVDGLVQRFAVEEAMVREARRLGLDRGDPIIRRRLVQKMQFLLDGPAEPPSESEVQQWFEQKSDRYRLGPAAAFQALLFSSAAQAEAFVGLGAGPEAAPAAAKPTPYGRDHRDINLSRARRQFGDRFAAALERAPTGRWSGPIDTPQGAWAIYVEQRTGGRLPALDQVRERVLRDLRGERARARAAAARQRLLETYEVKRAP